MSGDPLYGLNIFERITLINYVRSQLGMLPLEIENDMVTIESILANEFHRLSHMGYSFAIDSAMQMTHDKRLKNLREHYEDIRKRIVSFEKLDK